MKRLVLNLIMAAGLLFAFSACQKEETFPNGDLQQITVNIPSVTGTRASISDYGTGSNVDRCILQVYRNDNKYGEQIVVPVTGGKATFNLRLVATHTYDFVFWADCSQDGGYYNTEDLTSITAKNYAGNNDKFDAFFYAMEDYRVTGPFTEEITLKRPFGQMNIVTTDIDEIPDADLKPTHVKVVFSELPTAFNAKSGAITAYTKNVTYTAPVINNSGDLSVDYILAGADESTLADFSVEFLYNGTSIAVNDNFKSIPVRRNYKTNISGNLLTKEGIFDITVDPLFETPDIDIDYPELHAAFENGGSVTLDKDVVLDAPLVLEGDGKVVDINLNGHDIINNVSVPDAGAPQYGNTTVFEVKGGATLNISGNGKVHAISTEPDEDGYRMAVYALGNSTVNIYGGDFMNNQDYNGGNAQLDLIYADQNAVINIYGGRFESKCANSRGYWVLNLKDGSNAEINVYGGTFVNFDPSNSMTENPVKNFVAPTSTTVKVSQTPSPNGTYEVVPQGEKVSVPVEAGNAEELENALENAAVEDIVVTADVDLSAASVSEITFDEPKAIEIAEDATLKTAGVTMVTQKGLTITGGTIDNSPVATTAGARRVMAASETHEHKSLIHIYGGELVLDGVTLINDPDYHWHGSSYNTAAIAYWNDADVTIRNSHIVSGEFTLCGMGRGVASGVITLEDSYFESTSSNKDNGKYWAYAMRLFGSKIRIENCEVKGIQGAISIEGCKDAVISSGKYYTVNSEGNKDAFYALYLTNDAVATITGGEFIGGNDWSGGLAIEGTSAVVSGDNDTGLPYGSVILKGGKFSGKAYNHETQAIYEPSDGYKWQAISKGDLKWEVVSE